MSGFEVVCSADHSSTGGATPGFVVSVYDTESKAQKSILFLMGIYPHCVLSVQERGSDGP